MAEEFDVSVFRPDRPGIRKVLGDLEAEIMELVWAHAGSQRTRGTTVRDVFAVLYEQRPLAYTTVMNTMTRLAKKNLLRVEKQDLGYVYYPNFTQDEFITRFVGRILADLLVSFSGPALESLAHPQDPRLGSRAHELLAEIERRRAAEEPPDAPPAPQHERELR